MVPHYQYHQTKHHYTLLIIYLFSEMMRLIVVITLHIISCAAMPEVRILSLFNV